MHISTAPNNIADELRKLADSIESTSGQVTETVTTVVQSSYSPFLMGITILVLAAILGYYVIWRVTPALHSPLMSVTNAISSVVIIGALIAAGGGEGFTKIMGFLAIVLASINIFGGFFITHRMLQMFRKK